MPLSDIQSKPAVGTVTLDSILSGAHIRTASGVAPTGLRDLVNPIQPTLYIPTEAPIQATMQAPIEAPTQVPISISTPAPIQAPLAPAMRVISGASAKQESGLIMVPFGTLISRFPIDAFKVAKGSKYRIGIINDEIAIAKMHYTQGIGHFYCFSGVCCEHHGIPNVKYIIPIVVYDVDKDGKAISTNFDVKYLRRSDEQYTELLSLQAAGVDVFAVDFLVTCKEEKFQNMTLMQVGPAVWKNPQNGMIDPIKQKLLEVWHLVGQVVGRKIDESTYYKLIDSRDDSASTSSDSSKPLDIKTYLNG